MALLKQLGGQLDVLLGQHKLQQASDEDKFLIYLNSAGLSLLFFKCGAALGRTSSTLSLSLEITAGDLALG